MKKCLALLAALLVGVGMFSGSADAAPTLNAVEVTSPGNGAQRGIDSTFVITAKVVDFSTGGLTKDSLEVVIYLIAGNDSTVVGDTQNATVDFGALDQASVILIAQDKNASAGRYLKDGGTTITGGNLVAVQQKRGRDKPGGSSVADKTKFKGDADSVVVSVVADTTFFTWYAKVHNSSGTITSVRAAAFAIRDEANDGPTANDTSLVALSSASKTFKVDGDRPKDPQELISVGTVGAVVVTDLTRGSTDVIGIGDTIKTNVRLGSQANAVLLGDSLSVVSSYFGKTFTLSKTSRAADTLQQRLAIAEGAFGDLLATGSDATPTGAAEIFIVDQAGNRSGPSDAAAAGVTTGLSFLVDSKRPALDAAVVAGDTIIPASGDTISEGTLHNDYEDDGAGPRPDKVLSWNLPEALDSLLVAFDGVNDLTLKLKNSGLSVANKALQSGAGGTRRLDFTNAGDAGPGSFVVTAKSDGTDSLVFSGGSLGITKTPADSALRTGLHTINFTATDLAGNVGSTLSRTNVYIDVDDLQFVKLFPTIASLSGADTLEEETSKVVFRLSEPADSVIINYVGTAGPDDGKTRSRRLSGSSLTNTTSEQTLPVDSLKHGTRYTLTVLGRDLAGNFTRSTPQSFLYDTSHVVPVVAKFLVSVPGGQKGYGNPNLAGTSLVITVTAATTAGKTAVTYRNNATLTIAGGHGVAMVSGTGATDLGGGKIALNVDDWNVGSRTVTIKDTAATDTLGISVTDTIGFTGALDSVVVYQPAAYAKIVVDAPDTVTAGDRFWVGIRLSDTFGNTRTADNRYVQISSDQLGVNIPPGDVYLTNGKGGAWVTASEATASLSFDVRDLTATGVGPTGRGKSNAVVVLGGDGVLPGDELGEPNGLEAHDYAGATGEGDQGGFVLLTFGKSDDHETLTAYRIWREVLVDYDEVTDTLGVTSLVHLDEPVSKFIPWAKVDAVPGVEGAMYVVVATLDNDATQWGVSAERGRETTAKQAFVKSEAVASPYEVMARTMMKSKEAVKTSGPVFATLTPEAMAFVQKGVAPRLKSTTPTVISSKKVYTKEPVRAIDNIAPEAIPSLRVFDTPNDAGGSVTISWTKSVSDRLLPRGFANAVGPVVSDQVPGVEGYNVYRKTNNGDYTMIGSAPAGETSYVDGTVLNGERYTYKVSPYDQDNTTPATIERTGMAIRNRVFDKAGAAVFGLFGVDNKVDFDDFFLLADRFGTNASDEGFEPAFDLNPDNKIDFDDFFRFADNFGKAIEAVGKVVPVLAGLNSDARLDLSTGNALPRIGEELAVAVDLGDFVEVKGYGFSLSYDPTVLEFVRVAGENSLLGESQLAQPQILNQTEGSLSLAAFGDAATKGSLGVNVIFRTKKEIENSYVDLTEGMLRDSNFSLNQVASLGSIQVQTRPEAYGLADNYPNPFNPETTIKYQLPEAADVTLNIYNVVGQVVRSLVLEHQSAGRYIVQWDANNDNGQPLSSGIYFYHLQAGDFQKTKKMLLLK